MLASPASQDETQINLLTPDKEPATLTSNDKAVEPNNAAEPNNPAEPSHDKDWERLVFGSISKLANTDFFIFP